MKYINKPTPEGEARVHELLARIRESKPRASAAPETRVAELIRRAREAERGAKR